MRFYKVFAYNVSHITPTKAAEIIAPNGIYFVQVLLKDP